MGKLDDANAGTDSIIKRVTGSPLFHTALPLIAAAIVASEHRWPTLKENIAGVILLLTRLGAVTGAIMSFVSKSDASPPADPPKA